MWFYKFLLPYIIEHMTSHGFKRRLVESVNKNLDIPMIDENTEKQVFDALYDTILNVLKNL